MTSTKKQKMMISRAVVEEVKTKLNPPGRFLEKNAETGLWHEVTDKRALEKTAQAFRDGSAHLRQKLPDEVSDSASDSASFSEALSKGDVSSSKSFDQSVSETKLKLWYAIIDLSDVCLTFYFNLSFASS